jgi:hypothetical protein
MNNTLLFDENLLHTPTPTLSLIDTSHGIHSDTHEFTHSIHGIHGYLIASSEWVFVSRTVLKAYPTKFMFAKRTGDMIASFILLYDLFAIGAVLIASVSILMSERKQKWLIEQPLIL